MYWAITALELLPILTERFPTGSLPRMLEGIRTFTDPETARDVQAFLDAHPLPTGARQVEQHTEAMWATVHAAARLAQEPVE